MRVLPELEMFQGRWALERSIHDRRADQEGTLSGVAVFSVREAGGLLYEETGHLRYGEHPPMDATRRYIWRDHARGIEVLFDDTRPFHIIETDRLMPDANHYCGSDVYHVSYQFADWPEWSSRWRVMGPSKDYGLLTQFRRMR